MACKSWKTTNYLVGNQFSCNKFGHVAKKSYLCSEIQNVTFLLLNWRSGHTLTGFLFIYCFMAYVYMTQEGYNKLIEQIKQMESVDRPRISAQIAEARDKGDLSENAEYDAAKEAQGMLEMKIAQLKDTLSNARIIDESKISNDTIQILSKVKVKDTKSGRVMDYALVSESEANIRQGKLAVSTPIGKALLGHKVGDVVEVTIPAGVLHLEVIEISI